MVDDVPPRVSWKVDGTLDNAILELMSSQGISSRTKALEFLYNHFNTPERHVRMALENLTFYMRQYEDDPKRVAEYIRELNIVIEDFFKDDLLIALTKEYHDWMRVKGRYTGDAHRIICDKVGIPKEKREHYLRILSDEVNE